MEFKAAIFHDYFDEIGGAEIIFLNMARALNAKIFTTNISRESIAKLGFSDVLPRMYSIGKVPNTKHLKQLVTQLRFSFLKISEFDIYIFGGSYSIHASKNHKSNLWYCIGLLRGLYGIKNFRKSNFGIFINLFKNLQIFFDRRAVRKIKRIVSISDAVRKRIKDYYYVDCDVVYPPIETENFWYAPGKNYWLIVTRVDPYKQLEILLNAFAKMPNERLVVVGGCSYELKGYFSAMRKNSPNNVSFIGAVYDYEKIREFYSNCKGFIATSKNEDFGMNVVEAMASGKPVIAGNEGGYKETIINGKTGILIDNINEDKIVEAVKLIGKNPSKYKKECQKQARKFDTNIFIKKIEKEIEKTLTK